MLKNNGEDKNVNGICIHLHGAMCAGSYCDYWDADNLICSLARETKLKAELFQVRLDSIIAEKQRLHEEKLIKEKRMKFMLSKSMTIN